MQPSPPRHWCAVSKSLEQHAVTRGCKIFYLETFSFQAPALYRSLAYEVKVGLSGFELGIEKYTQDAVTVVVLKGHWRIKKTGVEIEAKAANLFTFADNKIQSYTVMNNTTAFAEALGK